MFAQDAAVQVGCDLARRFGGGRFDLEHVHAVEDGLRNRALVVGGGDPDHLAGVDRHFGELVHEVLRRVVLQQAVERAQWVVLRVGAGLVDLVDHDHRVGVLAVHQGLEHLARFGALPLRRGPRQQPAGRHRAHRDQAHAGTQQVGDLFGEMGLAHAGWPEQQDRGHLQAVAAVLAEGHVALHVVQHLTKIGQQVVQRCHVGHARGFDSEALGAAFEHALPGVAQALVFAFVATGLQVGQLALDLVGAEHAAHPGDGQSEGG
ncbi:hypothetical protein Y695_02913 [Hydrogenophaga sp. T4]|nr:hypothetical protein Y695_02913 [Hydrogenophaga sp. T4]